MSSETSSHLPFVLFQIQSGLFAVNSENVHEIVILPKVVAVPNLPPEIRGVINLRGKVMHVVDLRMKLGLPSAKADLDELIQLLHDREQDHTNWLAELENCVRENRQFKLARDPHTCKFGKWYDTFQTNNNLLKMALKKMDEPHRIIHAAADEVLNLAHSGNERGALELLATRRSRELAGLSQLFEDSRRILLEHHRELAVVLGRGAKRLAISIDLMESVERIPQEDIEPMSDSMPAGYGKSQWRIGKRAKTNQTILLLDEDSLFAAGGIN